MFSKLRKHAERKTKRIKNQVFSYNGKIKRKQSTDRNPFITKKFRIPKKITEMRQKQYANELKELRQVPKINKISQKIAKTKEKYEFLTIPKNTNQILKTFRQSTSNTPYPLQSYIKVTDLLNESSVTERKSDSVAKLSVFYENRSENNNKSLIKDDFELRKVSVNDFLSAMVNRSCIFDEKK
jgi:hypothetical protein